MANPKLSHDYAETEVLPRHLSPSRLDALDDAAAEAQLRYQEYVRLLDEVPVLVDVVREPPRVPIKDFRLGERPDTRKLPRDDAAALREQHAVDVTWQYAEYAGMCSVLATTMRAPPRNAAPKGRSKKKRAKRSKRSARSKS